MSISGWMRDTVSIKREEFAKDSEGVAVKTWTTAERGSSYPHTSVRCRIQDLPPEQVFKLGGKTDLRMWKIYFDSEPYIDTRDHVFFTDTDSIPRECDVFSPSFSYDSLQARLWKCIVREFKELT